MVDFIILYCIGTRYYVYVIIIIIIIIRLIYELKKYYNNVAIQARSGKWEYHHKYIIHHRWYEKQRESLVDKIVTADIRGAFYYVSYEKKIIGPRSRNSI